MLANGEKCSGAKLRGNALDLKRVLWCLLVSASACVPMMVANMTHAPAGWVLGSAAVPAIAVVVFLVRSLRLKGTVAIQLLGVISRCALVAAGLFLATAVFGLVAFLLELSAFSYISTQAALTILETLAFAGAVLLSPVAVMMLAGSYGRESLPPHPIAEAKAARGAYVPIVATTIAASAIGWLSDVACSFAASGVVAVCVLGMASIATGAAWLLAVSWECRQSWLSDGGSEWWKAKVKRVWDRRVGRIARAGVSCFLALALCYSTIGDALPAFAESLNDQPANEPANSQVYEPPSSAAEAEPAEEGTDAEPAPSPAAGQEGAVGSSGDFGAADEAPAPEPDMPALPPIDYYDQPDLEGAPVAMEEDATLLKTSERTYTTVIGGASVAYETPSGDVRAIDNTMEAADAGPFSEPSVYRNKENAFVAELPIADEEGQQGLLLKVGSRDIRIIPQGVDFSRSVAQDEAVRYTEAREGIDWQYTLIGSVVKEDIVLNQPVEEQPFDSLLLLPSGTSARIENGVCRVYDTSSGETVMDISAPLMTDALGAVCDDVSLALERTDAGLVLKLLPNWGWLSSAERAYPIRIDPTDNIAPQAVRVGCVEQRSRNGAIGENGYSYAGYDDGVKTGTSAFKPGGHGICRVYAEINYDFSYIMSEARIDSATFSLSQFRAWSGGQTNFGLYRVVDPWAFDGLTWAKQETFNHEIVGFRQARTSQGYIDWDVRECVNNWVQGIWTQRGFCVMAEFERGMQCELFQNRSSANPPRLTINWSVPDPVDEGRSLDDTTVNLRTLTEHDADNKLQFDGVFADGLATPRATVLYNLDPLGETGVSYASRSYKYPDSSSWQDSIPNATRYKDKLSNWQSHVFSNLAYDTLYKVRALASKDGAAGREAASDSFLVYKATTKDTLPYIASHYGVTLDQLARDNRVQDCLVVGGNTIFVRNPKTNTPYNPQNLTEDQKRRIDSGLMGRGKHCEYGFEPVNMNTGNFVLEGIDAVAEDAVGDFELKRTYNSRATESGAMGRGWSMAYTDHLSAEASGAIVLTASDGASYWFDPDGEGGYVLDGDAGFELKRIAYKADDAAEDAPDLYRYEVRDRDENVFSFDCYGMLTSVADRRGLVTTVEYDDLHQMSRIVSPSGRFYAFEHDGQGRISSATLPDGSKVSYAYDARGDLVEVTEAGGGRIAYVYDEQGRMVEWRDPSGAPVVRNVYDDEGRVTAQTDANGNRSTIAYAEGSTVATDARGNSTTYRFDELFRTTGIAYPDGHVVSRSYDAAGNLASDENGTYAYDADGNMTSSTDLRGMTTSYVYDGEGNVVSETHPDGEVLTNAYDDRGNLVSQASSFGGTTAYAYDDLCRMVSKTDADGYTTSYFYAGPDLVAETDAAGNTTTYSCDAMGRRISETDPAGNTARTTYDAMGRITSQADGAGGTTRYVLDSRGLLASLADPNGGVTTYAYDDAWNMTSMTNPAGSTWTYAYDAEDNCVSESDPLGNTTARSYDAMGRLASETSPTGVSEAWSYDGFGRVTSHRLPSGGMETFAYEGRLEEPAVEVDALGNVTTRTFDAMGNVASATYPDGGSERWEYRGDRIVRHVSASGLDMRVGLSAAGRIRSISQSGRTWTYSYDAAGRLGQTIDPLGQASSVVYDAAGNISSVSDEQGAIASFAYDGAGRETAETDALGNVARVSYDAAGNVLAQTDALGRTTAYAYDAAGNVASVTDAAGGVSSYAYDATGNLIAETNALGSTTSYTYDGIGAVTSTTDPIGRTTRYVYDSAGNAAEEVRPDGESQRFAYDAAGRMTAITDFAGTQTSLELDWRGNVVRAVGPAVGEERYSYDAEGRLSSYVDPAGRTASTVYDLWGNAAAETTAQGLTIFYATDALGRTVSESKSSGGTTKYAYDARGNVTSTVDPNGNTTSYAYDALGQMLSHTDALGATTAWSYDAAGNMTKQVDADGYASTLEYDALNRPVVQTDGNGSPVAVSYDAAGNVVSVVDALGSEDAYAYDAAGQLVRHVDAAGGEEEYGYDACGQLVRHVAPDGAVTSYEYDLVGNLSKVTDALGATTKYVTDAKGNVIKVRNAAGAEYSYAYDGAGRMTRMASPLGYVRTMDYGLPDSPVRESDSLGLSITYELDSEGRPTKATASGFSETWKYDPAGNLASHADKTGAVESYAYDAAGRLAAYVDGSGVKSSYRYDGRGNLTSEEAGSVGKQYSYDGASNLTAERVGDRTVTTYAYDAAGRLVSETDATGATERYEYDALGNLAKQVDALGNAWAFSYDAVGNLTRAVDPTGATTRWDYDKAGHLSGVVDADDARTGYERDKAGNVSRVTDALGNATDYAYDIEGNLTGITSADGSEERMTYDPAGRMTALTKQSGSQSRYDYDALGNLMDKAYSSGGDDAATYTYDGEGRVATRTDQCGTATYSYDGAGRLASETDGFGQKLAYAYDDAGNLARMEYPDGQVVEYAYTESGNISSVATPEGAYSYAYDERDLCVGISRPSSVETSMSYDAEERVTLLSNRDASGKVLSEFAYSYDAAGRIASEDSTVVGEDGARHETRREFAYTPAGKLSSCSGTEDGKGFSEEYAYDAKGNRTSLERTGDGAERVSYSYDAADRLMREESSTRGAVEYSYDADGQLVSKTGDGHDFAYDYGVEGRLEAVRDGDLLLMSAAYDGDDKRVGTSTLYHQSRDLAAVPGASLLVDLLGGEPQDEVRIGKSLSAAVHAMAAMAGAYSCAANPSLACEAVPIAVRCARELFGMGGAYVPEGIPRLLLDAGGLSPAKAGLSVTDEAYDTTSFAISTAFEVPQVAASSSTRDGASSLYYGASRLSQASGAGARDFLEDGRGSTVQEATTSGAVASWRAYSASGALSAGSDAAERPFFGYNGEMQDAATGLVYMRARHYDAASGRFGSADSVLGSLAGPLSLNRYLYCGADPVNYADPTGHVKAKVKKVIPMDPQAQGGRAQIPTMWREFNQMEIRSSLSKNKTFVNLNACINTLKWTVQRNAQLRAKYGDAAAKAFRERDALTFAKEVLRIYCGKAARISDGTYNREVAIAYAYLYSIQGLDDDVMEYVASLFYPGYRNPDYPSFGGNCANFVSQVLHEGGYPMTQDWHAYPKFELKNRELFSLYYLLSGRVFDRTNSWSLASDQFEYFSNPANGFTSKQVIDIHKGTTTSGKGGIDVGLSDLPSRLSDLGIQPGDVMYFYNEEEGVHHATVISGLENGEILYSGNTVNRFDWKLSEGIKSNDGVLIVRINDNVK